MPSRPGQRVLLALGAVALAFWVSLRSTRRPPRLPARSGLPSHRNRRSGGRPVGRGVRGRPHLAAPLLLAGVALVLFLESAWTRAPLTEAWASAALIMCASLLLPVGPLDGKHLDKAGLAMSAGVIGAALLFGLGLL